MSKLFNKKAWDIWKDQPELQIVPVEIMPGSDDEKRNAVIRQSILDEPEKSERLPGATPSPTTWH